MGLNKVELSACLLLMIGFLIVLMSTVYNLGHGALRKQMVNSGDLLPGWILPSFRDVSDYEWMTWKTTIYESAPWFAAHLILGDLTRHLYPKCLPLVYVSLTSLFILLNYPGVLLGYFVSQIVLFYIIILFKSKLLVWITGTMILTCYNSDDSMNLILKGNQSKSHVIVITVGWFIIRCLGFSLAQLTSAKVTNFQSLAEVFAYAFYFPTFHFGPYIPFEEFRETLYSPPTPWRERLLPISLSLVRYGFYFLCFEIACHLFYCHSLMFHFNFSPDDSALILNSVCYCVAQFFYLKYVIMYGVMGTLARAEGFWAPPHPRCIHHIHRSSDIWRYFDRGFYLFMLRCIYKPICGKSISRLRRLFASFMCFCFVCLWHGASETNLYWAVLNFVGITLEALMRLVDNLKFVIKAKDKFLSDQNKTRFQSLVMSPLWILTIISNSFFFCGTKIGILYFEQFLKGTWRLISIYILVSYCLAQVSNEINLRLNFNKKPPNDASPLTDREELVRRQRASQSHKSGRVIADI